MGWQTGPHGQARPRPSHPAPNPAEGFWGTVLLMGTESICAPNGKWCSGFYGYIKILSADITGMKPARGESPWVAQVSGEKEDVWVPGCKVGAVQRGPVHRAPNDYVLTGRDETNSHGLDIWEVP